MRARGLVVCGMFDEFEDPCGGGFTGCLGRPDPQDAGQVDAAGQDFVVRGDAARDAFSGQGDGIQRGVSFEDDAVHGDFVSRADQDRLSGPDFFRGDIHDRSVAFEVGDVRADVHQMGDRTAGTAFRNAFEEFAYLEKEHDENGFGKLGLRARQETDGQCAEGGDAHQEVLVEGFTVAEGFRRFFQRIPADEQVGNQVEQQVLPGRPVRLFLDDDGGGQQEGRGGDFQDPPARAFFFVLMVMVVAVFLFVAVPAGFGMVVMVV